MAKKTKTIIALLVVIVLLLGIVISLYLTDGWTTGNKFCLFGHDYDDNGICIRCGAEQLDEFPGENANVRGGAILTVSEEGGNVQVAVTPLAASADVPAAVAANSWTITVKNIVPSYADNPTFDWSIRWKNAESAWATGKNVADYGTITPESDGAKEAIFHNPKDFGEQIEIVVTSREKPELSKIVLVDYVQKITGITFNMPDIKSETMSFTYEFTTTAYTIESNLSLTVGDKMWLNEDFVSAYLYSFSYDFPLIQSWEVKDYILMSAKISSNSRNTITISRDTSVSIDERFYVYSRSLDGYFLAFRFDDLTYMYDQGLRPEEAPGLLTSLFIKFVTEFADDADLERHAEFDVSFQATYNGTVYSSGTKTVGVKFNGESLHIPLEDFDLSVDHIYA